MSKLLFVSNYPDKYPDKVIATFDGSAIATLGEAIAYFDTQTLERCKRFVSGEISDVPEVIVESAQHIIDQHSAEAGLGTRYTVTHTPTGFTLWVSDGPDRYQLID